MSQHLSFALDRNGQVHERLSIAPSGSGLNTLTLFASGPPAGARLIPLREPKDLGARRLPFSADVCARIAAEFCSGYDVVLYDRPWIVENAERTGWWQVDPSTGDAVGFPKTQVCYRGGMTPLQFWGQSARDIAAQLGKAWNEETVRLSLDAQMRVLRVGIH